MRVPEDKAIEHRIDYEIIVDIYEGDGGYAMAWHGHLENSLNFPFVARDITRSSNEALNITGILDVEECTDGMYVYFTIKSDTTTDELPVNLEDLEVVYGDDATKQAVNDWRYWCARAYQLTNFEDDEEDEYHEEDDW